MTEDKQIVIEAGKNYTLKESAGFLRVSYGLIYQMARAGTLRTFRMGTQYRVPGSSLLDMVNCGQ